MGYRLKRLDEPIFMAGPKPMRTDFGIHQRLESCVRLQKRICYGNTKDAYSEKIENIYFGSFCSCKGMISVFTFWSLKKEHIM